MLWHILAPDTSTPGQFVSWDYAGDLTVALDTLRNWRWRTGERGMAIAKGPNGEALHYVMFTQRKGESKRALSVHRTRLGAKRAYLKFGRSSASSDPALQSWGWEEISSW